MAKAVLAHPGVRAHLPPGKTEAEIAAELQQAMAEAMQDPEVKQGRSEYESAMQALWKLTGGGPPKKPWWKFW